MQLSVPLVDDFEVTGSGEAPAWAGAAWERLARVGEGPGDYATRVKTAYSPTGLYVLFDCEDTRLTCTMTQDNDDLFREDVVELFLWTDERQPLYFEYEISPLGVELPILVSNSGGSFHGWLPWHYEDGRRIRARTSVRGGAAVPLAAVTGWMAEVFIPFALFQGLGNCPPHRATTWRANFYRIDYDEAPASQWAWCERTGPHFHNYKGFGTIRFE